MSHLPGGAKLPQYKVGFLNPGELSLACPDGASGPTWVVGDSEAEQVRRFYEQPPSIVPQSASVQQISIHIISWR